MSVRKRGGVWQIDLVIRRGNERVRVRKTSGVATRAEALKVEAEERTRLEGAPFVKGRAPFFSDFADEFLKTYSAVNNKPSEKASKTMILKRHLKPFFGHHRLDAIGVQFVEQYKAEKRAALNDKGARKWSDKSINNHLIVLQKLFAVAVEWQKTTRVPKFKRITLAEPPFDFLTSEEGERLVNAAESAWRPMVLLALRSGLRINELIALRWDDVDLHGGRLIVRHGVWEGQEGTPKGGKSGEVPLSHEALLALASLPSRFAKGLVFPGKGGKMLNRGQCNRPLWRACRKAELRKIGWHVCRHSFASQLAMGGVSLKAIQELMRLASIAMVLRYAHLSPVVRREAVALLDVKPASTAQNKKGQTK